MWMFIILSLVTIKGDKAGYFPCLELEDEISCCSCRTLLAPPHTIYQVLDILYIYYIYYVYSVKVYYMMLQN